VQLCHHLSSDTESSLSSRASCLLLCRGHDSSRHPCARCWWRSSSSLQSRQIPSAPYPQIPSGWIQYGPKHHKSSQKCGPDLSILLVPCKFSSQVTLGGPSTARSFVLVTKVLLHDPNVRLVCEQCCLRPRLSLPIHPIRIMICPPCFVSCG
jgi:hypothetical protein